MTNGRLYVVDLDAFGRHNAHQRIVHRPRQLAPIHDKLAAELQNMRRGFGCVLLVALAALLHDVQEQEPALARINPIGPCIQSGIDRRSYKSVCGRIDRGFLTSHRDKGSFENSERGQACAGRPDPNLAPHSLDSSASSASLHGSGTKNPRLATQIQFGVISLLSSRRFLYLAQLELMHLALPRKGLTAWRKVCAEPPELLKARSELVYWVYGRNSPERNLKYLETKTDGAVGTIVLNHPEKRNALSSPLIKCGC